MISFFYTLGHFIRAIWRGMRDPEFRALALLVVLLLLAGMFFYARVEGWNLLDSLFFCVATLTTIGYGDPVPHTTAGKVFTIIYIFIGIGVLLAFIERVARSALQKDEKKEELPKEQREKAEGSELTSSVK